jgi:hypothetical protein
MFTPKLFVETSVALKVGTVHLPEQDWIALVHYLSRKFQFVVSPNSFFEVINRLARGHEACFPQNLRGLRALSPVEPFNPRFLAMPGQFALKTLLDLPSRTETYTPDQLEGTMAQILLQTTITPALQAWLAETSSQIRAGKDSFVQVYEHVPGTTSIKPDRSLWAREHLIQLGLEPTDTQIEKFGAGLDLAFGYHAAVHKQTANPSYSPARDASSWLDEQQLFYLCDPGVHMLYLDSDFVTRIPETMQTAQLLNLRDLIQVGPTGA